jgi:hypothetical protein
MLALFLAIGGGAFAAGTLVNGDRLIKKASLSGNRLRDHSITGTQVNVSALGKVPSAGTADSAGRATTADTANNANHATSADTAKNANHATTADTATNATNATNASHAGVAAYAATFPTTLPAGETLRGEWQLAGPNSSDVQGDGQSFVFTLPAAPSTHVIPAQPTANPDPADCPGTANSPQAASGQFCMYVAGLVNVSQVFPCSALQGVCVPIDRFGFFVSVGLTNNANPFYAAGTWAVTAN